MQTSKVIYKRWYENNKLEIRAKKSALMRKLRSENPNKYKSHAVKCANKLKESLFNIYGKKCSNCNFSDVRAITLDHKNNNGAKERKEIGERGCYRRALKPENFNDYQMLCMNCQFIKRREPGGDWHRPMG